MRATICYSNEARTSLADAILKDIANIARIPGNVLDYGASGEIIRHLQILLNLLANEQRQVDREAEEERLRQESEKLLKRFDDRMNEFRKSLHKEKN